jgi:tRNA threonylcarbamoyladenosine biosynthesis protein TsaB
VPVLGFDTATPATAIALRRDDGVAFEARHDPEPDERPGHATRLLGLVEEVLAAARVERGELTRIAVGTGPGSFTGLRIGVGTARALAQALDVDLVGVPTLRALAAAASDAADPRPVAAILDARRGEAFVAVYAGGEAVLEPAALAPTALAAALASLRAPPLAVGDGALRFRVEIEAAGADVPPDDDPLHRVSARHLCELAAEAEPPARDAVLPLYVRAPDAQPIAKP